MCDMGQVKAAGMPLSGELGGLTRTDVAGLREAPLFQEPIAFRSLIQLVAKDSEAFPRLLALAVENRLVLHSALDILLRRASTYSRSTAAPQLRKRPHSQVLYPSNLDGQQVYWHDVHQAGVAAGGGLCYTPPRRATCPIAGSF